MARAGDSCPGLAWRFSELHFRVRDREILCDRSLFFVDGTSLETLNFRILGDLVLVRKRGRDGMSCHVSRPRVSGNGLGGIRRAVTTHPHAGRISLTC